MKIIRKQVCSKILAVLICLLIVGNSAHGVVLCIGADGHVEIESTWHERCEKHAHEQPTNQTQVSFQSDHATDSHCGPCVDVPMSIDLTKITRVSKDLNPNFLVPASNMAAVFHKFDLSAYNSASSAFDASSYFSSLRAVILQI